MATPETTNPAGGRGSAKQQMTGQVAGNGSTRPADADDGVLIVPVPADAPSPPARHGSRGTPAAVWIYRDAAGRVLFYVNRFDRPEGGKDVIPLTLRQFGDKMRWAWKGHDEPRPVYGLDRLAGRPDAPVIVTEGEKAADAASHLLPDFVCITSPNGAKSAAKADWSPLIGRRVAIWPDADPQGEAYADDVERHARAAGAASVGRLDLGELAAIRGEELPKGWDAADALAEGIDPAEIEWLAIHAYGGKSTPQADSAAARPRIEVTAGTLHVVVDRCEDALIAAGVPIYARGETLARAVPAPLDAGTGAIKRPAGGLILTGVTVAALQDDLERVAEFRRYIATSNGPKPVPADCPARACRALVERVGRWRFPQLRGIASAPFVRADGSVAATPGYDEASGLLLALPADWPPPLQDPTRADALAALAKLRHLIGTFAFVTPEDESVALSAMLMPLVRPGIEAAPMHGFSAPVRGSGKSMLADLVAILATGREAAAITWGPDAEENTKALTAALLAGDAVAVLDNVEVLLRGELLCSALTQSALRLRPLGRSELVTVPSVASLLATGNALTPAGDMTRRVLVAEMDPQCERPELREFHNDPKADALAARAELVNAGLTIITAGMRATFRRPPPLGSFTEWSRRVRDALVWLGMPDPVTVMERTFDGDPEREAAIAVLAAWREVFGTGSATAAEAAHAAKNGGPLADALESVATRGGTVSAKALGRWLRRHIGRVLDGLKVQKSGGDEKRGARWRVVEHLPGGVLGVSGVSYTATRKGGGGSCDVPNAQRPPETPITPETPPSDTGEDWTDAA
jgi:putative DNA primase/helicase